MLTLMKTQCLRFFSMFW